MDSFSHMSSDRILIVRVVEYFGRTTVLPRNHLASLFAELLGQKTLTPSDCDKIKALGYVIKQEEVKL